MLSDRWRITKSSGGTTRRNIDDRERVRVNYFTWTMQTDRPTAHSPLLPVEVQGVVPYPVLAVVLSRVADKVL